MPESLANSLLNGAGSEKAGHLKKALPFFYVLTGVSIGLLLSRSGMVVEQSEPAPIEAMQLPQAAKTRNFMQPAMMRPAGASQRAMSEDHMIGKAPQPVGAKPFAWQPPTASIAAQASRAAVTVRAAQESGFGNVDLTGKVALLAGASSEKGYGWAIAKELANAGATVLFCTWAPFLKIFKKNFPKLEEARTLKNGKLLEVAKIYPFDAMYDTPEQVPEDVKTNKRYKDIEGGFTIQEVVDQVQKDYGKIDILLHALANGPEVTKPLLETTREGYLAASSASAYSLVSMVSRFGPIMNPGGAVVSLSYIASTRVIPGYGGGMSSAKAQLESDTRTLAYEAGRKYGIRVNTIMAGPLGSRAATAISGPAADGSKPFIMRAIEYSETNAPLTDPLTAEKVAGAAFFLLTDMSAAVTGATLPVDMGLHAMGSSLDSPAYDGLGLTDSKSPTP